MPEYLLLLGQNTELSLAEVMGVVGDAEVLSSHIIKVKLESNEVAVKLLNILGGTVKIFKILDSIPLSQEEQIADKLITLLQDLQAKDFAIAEINRDHLPTIEKSEIKKRLKDLGFATRFVEGSRHGLSAAILIHQKNIVELAVIQLNAQIVFAQTLATQDIDHWTLKDREKPYFDRKKGMLPPKVARMMINLALSKWWLKQDLSQELKFNDLSIYDPFCGTGTILIEAAEMGFNIFGSDLDADSIKGTSQNLNWFNQFLANKIPASIFQRDVSQVNAADFSQKIDLIVSEPYLGRQTPNREFLPAMFKGLEKMYLGAFKKWVQILNDGAMLCLIFPVVEDGKKTYNMSILIDKISKLGYTLHSEPIYYYRPQARVKRQIVLFKFNR